MICKEQCDEVFNGDAFESFEHFTLSPLRTISLNLEPIIAKGRNLKRPSTPTLLQLAANQNNFQIFNDDMFISKYAVTSRHELQSIDNCPIRQLDTEKILRQTVI